MSESTQEKCVCGNQIDTEQKCPICKNKFITQSDMECPEHKKIYICGRMLSTCSSCIEKGYRYVSGYGGAPFINDTKLNKRLFIDESNEQELEEFLNRM